MEKIVFKIISGAAVVNASISVEVFSVESGGFQVTETLAELVRNN